MIQRTIVVFHRDQAIPRVATPDREALSAEGETQDLAREAGLIHAAQRPTASVAVVAGALAMIPHPAHDLAPQRPVSSRASALTHLLFPIPAPALVLRHLVVEAAALHTLYPALHHQNPNPHGVTVALQAHRLAPHLRVVEDILHLLRGRHLQHQDADAIQAAPRHQRARAKREMTVRAHRPDVGGILAPRLLDTGVPRLVRRRRRVRVERGMIALVHRRGEGGILLLHHREGGETRSTIHGCRG